MSRKVFNYLILTGLSLIALGAHALEFSRVLSDKSSIGFAYKQMNVPLDGKFGKFAAQIGFDPAKPEAAQARFEIDVASIDTGSSEADEEVVGKDWFNAKAFPTAKFVSTRVKPLGANRFEVQGQLTIKGKSLPVTAPFTFRQDGASALFDGSFTIKRLDFAIGEGEWADVGTVANEVQIRFHIVGAAASAQK